MKKVYVPGLRLTVIFESPPLPTRGPWTFTPLPLIEMSCVIGAWFGMLRVTLPAEAVALPYWNASAPVGFAGIVTAPFFSTAEP